MSIVNTTEYHHHAAHHFQNADAEYRASKLGVWIFLCTEILMFGGMFVGYILMHNEFPKMFAAGSHHMYWLAGGINTAVLIISSCTMALSIYYAQINQKKKVLISLYITLICGFLFMGIKAYEYTFHLLDGLGPGKFFSNPELLHQYHNMGLYFAFYFCMTGIHAFHVFIGMCLIGWLIRRAHKGHFSSEYYTPLECVGLFWHLVDLIWIYLFPLLYLIH